MSKNFDQYYSNYVEDGFETVQVAYRRRKVIERLNVYKHNKILEIGCGLEPISKYINDFDEMTIVEPCIDFMENAKKILKSNEQIHFIEGCLEEKFSELREREYDLIVVSCLLHEVEDPKKFLNVLRQLCKNKTVVHINVPNIYSFHRILAKEAGIIQEICEKSKKESQYQRNRSFSIESLEYLLNENSFAIIAKGSYFLKPFSHEQMHSLLKEGIIEERVLQGLYNMVSYMPQYGSEIFVDCVTA